MLRCDMERGCSDPVTYIDHKGFVYCSGHGIQRQGYCRCRKLTKTEISKLERREAIKY